MTLQIPTLETKSFARQIADNIRAAIVQGKLKADDRLPTEHELAKRYGVSRPTIREALKRLAAQNLVRSRRGPSGGTFINRLNLQDIAGALGTDMMLLIGAGDISLEQVAEARQEFELMCCRLAVQRRRREHLRAMQEEIARQADPHTSDEDFCASDVRFHKALAAATGNPILQLNLEALLEAVQPASNMLIYRLRDRAQVVDQHRSLLDALRRRRKNQACSALTELMNTLKDHYATL